VVVVVAGGMEMLVPVVDQVAAVVILLAAVEPLAKGMLEAQVAARMPVEDIMAWVVAVEPAQSVHHSMAVTMVEQVELEING
jgi:hypothetical protein